MVFLLKAVQVDVEFLNAQSEDAFKHLKTIKDDALEPSTQTLFIITVDIHKTCTLRLGVGAVRKSF